MKVAEAAAASATEEGAGDVVDLRALEPTVVHQATREASSIPVADKVAWVRDADDTARSVSPEVRQVSVTYADSVQRLLIATSDGRWVQELRPRIRLVVSVV